MPRVTPSSSLSHRSGETARRKKILKNLLPSRSVLPGDEARSGIAGRFSKSLPPQPPTRFVSFRSGSPAADPDEIIAASLPTRRRLPVARSRGGSEARYTSAPFPLRAIVVGFVGRVPRFRSVAVDCVTRSVFFFLLDRFFSFSVGSIGSDSISQRWDHEL